MQEVKKIFPALTGIRAIAAYLVFLHHFNPIDRGGILKRLVNEFYIGVSIFFVLSGFLITYRYLDSLSLVSLRKYFLNRIARIYPIYFFITAFTFLFQHRKSFHLISLSDLKIFFLNEVV